MRLNVLQRMLEGLYNVPVEHAVEDFVISDPALAKHLDGSVNARDSREKLLLCQHEDEVLMSLYLDAAVLERLSDDSPLEELHSKNLPEFLLALEGVSHFLYVSWNAAFNRAVTLLELEMQAEVDKYVVASALFARQQTSLQPASLWRCLFDSPSFDDALDDTERSRYEDASHYAGRFCFQLENRYRRRNRDTEMMAELRKFYRLTQTGKISHINSADC